MSGNISPFPNYFPGNNQNNAANAIPVYVTSGGGGASVVSRYVGTWTDASGTATTTWTALLVANATRKTWQIQNTGAVPIYINFGVQPSSLTGALQINSGGSYVDPPEFVTNQEIWVATQSGTATFTCKEGN